jgi:hypothetical protein
MRDDTDAQRDDIELLLLNRRWLAESAERLEAGDGGPGPALRPALDRLVRQADAALDARSGLLPLLHHAVRVYGGAGYREVIGMLPQEETSGHRCHLLCPLPG